MKYDKKENDCKCGRKTQKDVWVSAEIFNYGMKSLTAVYFCYNSTEMSVTDLQDVQRKRNLFRIHLKNKELIL